MEVFKLQPYSTVGIFLSPAITITGIIIWAKQYNTLHGHYPRISSLEFSFTGDNSLSPDFIRNNLLGFWTACIVFWMFIVFFSNIFFGHAEPFELVKKYCSKDELILQKAGDIKYFGILTSGSYTTGDRNGDGNVSLTIVGTKGNFDVDSKLIKTDGKWKIESVKIEE